jgi:hypothetical protein
MPNMDLGTYDAQYTTLFFFFDDLMLITTPQ